MKYLIVMMMLVSSLTTLAGPVCTTEIVYAVCPKGYGIDRPDKGPGVQDRCKKFPGQKLRKAKKKICKNKSGCHSKLNHIQGKDNCVTP